MASAPRFAHRRRRAIAVSVSMTVAIALWGGAAAAPDVRRQPASGALSAAAAVVPAAMATPRWSWPLVPAPAPVVAAFIAPAHPYGSGHRGIDLLAAGDTTVHAPADGVVAFNGTVVDRGVLTIDHGDGLVTTFEPIAADVAAGSVVHRGDALGTVAGGGHAAPGTLHFGVRRNGVYINPLLLLAAVPRAVLLPCCA